MSPADQDVYTTATRPLGWEGWGWHCHTIKTPLSFVSSQKISRVPLQILSFEKTNGVDIMTRSVLVSKKWNINGVGQPTRKSWEWSFRVLGNFVWLQWFYDTKAPYLTQHVSRNSHTSTALKSPAGMMCPRVSGLWWLRNTFPWHAVNPFWTCTRLTHSDLDHQCTSSLVSRDLIPVTSSRD